jgi:hypothetical protein
MRNWGTHGQEGRTLWRQVHNLPCDTFSGVVKAGVNDSYYQGGEHADKSRDTDDYGFSKCEGITRFVNEQLPIEDRLIMYNLNGHAVFVKIAGD